MKIRKYHVDLRGAWQFVKRYRLLPLRGKYALDYQTRQYIDEFDRGATGAKRVFSDEKRDDCVGFAEFFDCYGAPRYIEFYDGEGEAFARMYFCVNLAEFYFHPVKLD